MTAATFEDLSLEEVERMIATAQQLAAFCRRQLAHARQRAENMPTLEAYGAVERAENGLEAILSLMLQLEQTREDYDALIAARPR